MSGIWTDIKASFKNGDYLIKLIYINLAVFLLINIVSAFSFLLGSTKSSLLVDFLFLPAYMPIFIKRFWTIFTYMFVHEGFLHILFNILWLYWMGVLFVDLLGQKKLLTVYILGGLFGGLAYLIAYNTIPVFNPTQDNPYYIIGASASVMAIVIATATYMPDFSIRLFLIGEVKLKYIALASVVLDVIMINDGNPGGHIAHLGGAFFGFYWAYRLKKGKDISKPFTSLIDNLFSLFDSKKKKVYHSDNSANVGRKKSDVDQKEIDAILDKISKSGYDSLNSQEKEKLFRKSGK